MVNLPGFSKFLRLREGPGGIHPDVLGQVIPLKHLFPLDLHNLAIGHIGLEVEHLEALLPPVPLLKRAGYHVLKKWRSVCWHRYWGFRGLQLRVIRRQTCEDWPLLVEIMILINIHPIQFELTQVLKHVLRCEALN